jgi:NADPH:quinone reductase
MQQGLTAHYLARTTWPLSADDTCLVHAAAGGVGGLLVQTARLCGARVIGTVGSSDKVGLARQLGADAVIEYRTGDVLAEVRRVTDDRLCQVVYDGVGKDTVATSLACTAPRGLLAWYGQASGPVPPFDPLTLSNGSKFITRTRLLDYVSTRQDLLARAAEVFESVARRQLTVRLHRSYPLAEAAQAHRELEARRILGKVILVPERRAAAESVP